MAEAGGILVSMPQTANDHHQIVLILFVRRNLLESPVSTYNVPPPFSRHPSNRGILYHYQTLQVCTPDPNPYQLSLSEAAFSLLTFQGSYSILYSLEFSEYRHT